MHYTLTSRREDAVTVDGLGVLPAATRDPETNELSPSVTVVDEDRALAFKLLRGLSPAQVALPEGVVVEIFVGADTRVGGDE
jgi:hypothetical protein